MHPNRLTRHRQKGARPECLSVDVRAPIDCAPRAVQQATWDHRQALEHGNLNTLSYAASRRAKCVIAPPVDHPQRGM